MEYISMMVGESCAALMWLPDHDSVVQVRTTPVSDAIPSPLHDWSGSIVTPEDGERFLEAAFDHLFLQGFHPEWVCRTMRT